MAFHINNTENMNDYRSYLEYTLPTFLEGVVDITNKKIVIELGAKEYHLDYGFLLHNHDVVIKGAGMGKTKLILDETLNGFCQYIDDAILNFQGQDDSDGFCPINVTIENLTIKTNISKNETEADFVEDLPHSKIAHHPSYLIKCYNVQSFTMHHVEIETKNIETTCLDIRRGTNIDIRGCILTNYNRRWQGGSIWLRGNIENVVIEDNDFYKYGNDEVIAIFDLNSYMGLNDALEISKKNVQIRYNRFFCQDENGGINPESIINETGDRGKWDGANQRFITCFTNQDSNKELVNGVVVQRPTPCHQTISGIHLYNNEFYINAPSTHLFTAAFDKYTTFKDVSVKGNIINYGPWTINGNNTAWTEMMDFCVYYDTIYDSQVLDGHYDSFSEEPFLITGNTINCSTHARNIHTQNGVQYYADNHIIVDIKGTKVIFDENTVICTRDTYSDDEHSYATKGVELFHCGVKGGEIMFSKNHCEGLKSLMHLKGLSGNNPITKARVWGCGNYLQGNPRIVHTNILEGHEFMINNEIICDYPVFFLEEFANTGNVIFVGNRVYRDLSRVTHYPTVYGHIFYTGSYGNNIQSMKLVCCDNIFDNLITNGMYEHLQSQHMLSVAKYAHTNNIFSNHIE